MPVVKLIIHKFNEDSNFKTLNVVIQDGGNSDDVQFGEWHDGKTVQTKKNSERSACLVVKIVSGLNNSKLNLDTCARELQDDNFDTYINKEFVDRKSFVYDTENNSNAEVYPHDNSNTFQHGKNIVSKTNINFISDKNNIDTEIWNEGCNYNEETIQLNFDAVSPLEHSLEKVRENNARIMKNIHLLNRTLYYTKKRENLHIFSKSMKSFPCKTCGKCFVYETGLRRHCSLMHAITEIQPRWQVVWTCIQCFQVWPRQDQAIKHSSECFKYENAECVREIKTSSLLQCEFCEKVFTSIPRLLRHSKNHTTSKNYECNACSIAFLSYKVAEQHWLSCRWLKMYYSFSLPKLLLCNACDRKFKNYYQLYSHRYKVGHFMTKTHSNDVNSLHNLVYQCETCGQWFWSITPLAAHKSQCNSIESIITAGFEQKNFSGKDNKESCYVSA